MQSSLEKALSPSFYETGYRAFFVYASILSILIQAFGARAGAG